MSSRRRAIEDEAWLVGTVKKLADKAGIGMPEVAVYEGDANAFATGAFRNSSLVAVSTGLLNSMSREEIEAVLGHEVAHVANGDMVTLTLIQGVVNTFVVFLSRVVAFFVDRIVFRTERGTGPGYFITMIVAQIALRRAGEHHRGVVFAPTRVPRRRRQRRVSRFAAADDPRAGTAGRPAAGRVAEGAHRLRHHRQIGHRRAVRDASTDRGSHPGPADARASAGDELDDAMTERTRFKIEIEEGNGLWHDVRGSDGAVLTFDDEAAARAKLMELYPVLVQMERYGDRKRTRVLRILVDEDDWPQRKAA